MTAQKKRKQLSRQNRRAILYRKSEYCAGCLRWFPLRNLTTDHINPKSKGGIIRWDNIQLLCYKCNVEKGTMDNQQFIDMLIEQGIRHKPPTFTSELFELVRRYGRNALIWSSEIMLFFGILSM